MRFSRVVPWLSITFIIILGFGVYINSLAGGFLRDDNVILSENPAIINPSELMEVFTKCGAYAYPDKKIYLYRPMQILTYAVDHALWGSDGAGYHFTNVLLHLLVAVFLYWLLSLLCVGRFIPFIVSILFVAHPAYVRIVSHISARADPLSALFAIISLIFYIKYSKKAGVLAYIFVIFAFILSILSRENAIIIPAVLLFYNYQFREKVDIKLMGALIFVALLYAALRGALLRDTVFAGNTTFRTTNFQSLFELFSSVTDQLKLLTFPQGFKTQCAERLLSISSRPVIAGIVISPALLFAAFRSGSSRPSEGLAIIWFLITVFSTLILYPVGAHSSGQWIYLPSIGIFIAAAAYLERIYVFRHMKIAVTIMITGLIALYSYAAIEQNIYWSEPVNLYEMALEASPKSVRANSDLALAYEKAGKHDEAIETYNRMLEKAPDNPDIYVNLSAIQIIKRNPESAVALCLKAIELENANPTAHNNLAVAYYMQGKHELAIEECGLAIKYGYKVKQELIDLLRPYRE